MESLERRSHIPHLYIYGLFPRPKFEFQFVECRQAREDAELKSGRESKLFYRNAKPMIDLAVAIFVVKHHHGVLTWREPGELEFGGQPASNLCGHLPPAMAQNIVARPEQFGDRLAIGVAEAGGNHGEGSGIVGLGRRSGERVSIS